MFAKRVLSGICISSSITRRLEGNVGVGLGAGVDTWLGMVEVESKTR